MGGGGAIGGGAAAIGTSNWFAGIPDDRAVKHKNHYRMDIVNILTILISIMDFCFDRELTIC